MSKQTKYPDWITERSFGGIRTAEAPSPSADKTEWPDGPKSPMATECQHALIEACNEQEVSTGESPICLVFLVGGAGNGKSMIARETLAAVKGRLLDPPAEFAQRTYRFEVNNGILKVVNDATIPDPNNNTGPLVADLADALETRQHALVCVNRGVLLLETSGFPSDGASKFQKVACDLVSWLLEPGGKLDNNASLVLRPAQRGPVSDNYNFAEIKKGDRIVAVVHVTFMDQASLLEQWPPPEPDISDHRKPFKSRAIDVLPVLSDERGETNVAFIGPLQGAAKAFAADVKSGDLDPIASNADALSDESICRSWCSLMRGAEVIAGTHFTYRELWALFAHSLVGPVRGGQLSSLANWVDQKNREAKLSSRRLSSLMALGTLRTHMLLFDAGRTGRGDKDANVAPGFQWDETYSEALKAVTAADPLRSFGPSDGKDFNQLAGIIAGIEDGRLPVTQLAREDSQIGAYWSKLDAEIEEGIGAAVDPSNGDSALAKNRKVLLRWYGQYMYRLVALARGWSAHCTVVDAWQHAWTIANSKRRLAKDLQDAVLTIILPSLDNEMKIYFPVFQQRTKVAHPGDQQITLCIDRGKFRLDASTRGNHVRLSIEQSTPAGEGPPAASALLDFHMLREALARKDGRGFTDSLTFIEPRVERIRAGLVAHELNKKGLDHRYRFILRDRDIDTQ